MVAMFLAFVAIAAIVVAVLNSSQETLEERQIKRMAELEKFFGQPKWQRTVLGTKAEPQVGDGLAEGTDRAEKKIEPKPIRFEEPLAPEMKTAIAMHMLEKGMDTRKRSHVRAATRQVRKLMENLDDAVLVRQSEEIRIEDEVSASTAHAVEDVVIVDPRDTSIQID